MKSAASAVFATSLVFITAHAQQAQSDRPATASAATPAPGMDSSALAGSARASKIIGSNVYHGDTSIGQIEDVLVNLDSATSTAMILSESVQIIVNFCRAVAASVELTPSAGMQVRFG